MGINRGTVLDLINDVHRAGGFKDYNNYSYLFNQVDTMPESVEKPEPHWIPVTERLPEIETDVLLTAWDGKRYFVGWVDAFGKWYGDDEEVNEGYEPIAWCALPEPYKGVTT